MRTRTDNTVPNPDASGNIRHGELAFRRGLRTPEDVFRDHLQWNRGTAAKHHFCNGYYNAAKHAGLDYDEISKSLRFVDECRYGGDLSAAERQRRKEIWHEVTGHWPHDYQDQQLRK